MLTFRADPCLANCDPVNGGLDSTSTHWQIHVAKHVWGPYRPVGAEKHWSPEGFYGYNIPTRFMDDKVTCTKASKRSRTRHKCSWSAWLLTTGDYLRPDELYHLGWSKITLAVKPGL